MNSATNPSIPSVHTISSASLAMSATHTAFLAGFEAARAGKRAAAPKSYSNAERFAFKHGAAYARAFRSKTAQEALDTFLDTEAMWINSATCSVERSYEAGNYRVVVA